MDTQALAGEIDQPAYKHVDGTWLPEWQIADLLNAKLIPAPVPVETSQARGHLLATGEWAKIKLIANGTIPLPSSTTPEQRMGILVAAESALGALSETQTIQTDVPERLAAVQAMLGALVNAGVVSPASYAHLIGLTSGHVSRAQQLNLGSVTANDVGLALECLRSMSDG